MDCNFFFDKSCLNVENTDYPKKVFLKKNHISTMAKSCAGCALCIGCLFGFVLALVGAGGQIAK